MILSDGCMYLIEFEGGGRTGEDMNSLFLKKTMTMTIGGTRRSSRLFFSFLFLFCCLSSNSTLIRQCVHLP